MIFSTPLSPIPLNGIIHGVNLSKVLIRTFQVQETDCLPVQSSYLHERPDMSS